MWLRVGNLAGDLIFITLKLLGEAPLRLAIRCLVRWSFVLLFSFLFADCRFFLVKWLLKFFGNTRLKKNLLYWRIFSSIPWEIRKGPWGLFLGVNWETLRKSWRMQSLSNRVLEISSFNLWLKMYRKLLVRKEINLSRIKNLPQNFKANCVYK